MSKKLGSKIYLNSNNSKLSRSCSIFENWSFLVIALQELVFKLVIWSVEKVGNERLPELGQDIQVPEHGRVPFNRFEFVNHN